MTAIEYIKQDPIMNADLLELVRRGNYECFYFGGDAAVFHDLAYGLCTVCGNQEADVRRVLDAMPMTGNYMAHGALCRDLLAEKAGCTGNAPCRQARYCLPEAPQVPETSMQGVELRTLDESFLEIVDQTYGTPHTTQGVEERLRNKAIFGAFIDDQLAGFIGWHTEGSIGYLEVLPEYRRRGLGFLLETEALRRMLERGEIPFCHIYHTNEVSMNLQKKMGWTISDDYIYWMF